MKRNCSNHKCNSDQFIKFGKFFRKCDSKWIQRYRCKKCGKSICSTTGSLEYRFKVRREISTICHMYCSGMSLRRMKKVLNLNYKTVVRKVLYLEKIASIKNQKFRERLKTNPILEIQFDDLVTIEHTKLKPVSVSLAVDPKTRKVLALEVAKIPAFGRLAKLSRKKYGFRKNEHKEKLSELFKKLVGCVDEEALIKSDKHRLYPPMVKKYFPKAEYETYKSLPATIAGQGEMKKAIYDPLFYINHTFAMTRANINRLFRKTWCTTKRIDRLKSHLEIYQAYHNDFLV